MSADLPLEEELRSGLGAASKAVRLAGDSLGDGCSLAKSPALGIAYLPR